MNKNDHYENILIFDGVCMLCNSAVHFLHERLKKSDYKFIPSQSEKGEKYIQEYKLGQLVDSSLVLINNDNIFIKSRAVFVILNDMPSHWKLLRVFEVLPTKLLDWMYDRIANNRYLIFGKKSGDACYHEIETN